MHDRLPARIEQPGGYVSVAISDEECRLKKDETSIPYARRAAEERQRQPGEHRLDAEQKGGVHEYTQGENDRDP